MIKRIMGIRNNFLIPLSFFPIYNEEKILKEGVYD